MEVFSELLFYPIGWIYLWIKYRNKEKIKFILKEKYDDSYYDAGVDLALKFAGISLIILLLIFLLVVIVRIIYDSFF